MSRELFKFKIHGPVPHEVSAGTLARILRRLEDSIVAFAADDDTGLPAHEPALSLVEVAEGSEFLTFSMPRAVTPRVAALSQMLSSGDYSSWPRESHAQFYGLFEQVRELGWSLEILEDASLGIQGVVLTAERGMAPPAGPALVTGATTLLGRCLRVGGATSPKAEVRTARGGRLLHLEVSEALAKQLGKRLYEEVLLSGTATWEAPDWRLKSFKVSAVHELDPQRPGETFRELRERSSDAWDEVDALEFVASQRD
jgi:hypothetical protein